MMFQLSSNRPLLILALCTVALTAAWAVSFAVYKATPPRYSLVYDGAYYVYNNSVGNEWVHELWVDGKALEPGRDYPITITGSSALTQLPHSRDKRPAQRGRRAKTSHYVLDHVLIGVMMACGRPRAS